MWLLLPIIVLLYLGLIMNTLSIYIASDSDESEPSTSSFNFLHDKPPGDNDQPPDDTEEDGVSSFDFLKSPSAADEEEQTGSGFSFLNQTPVSHDLEQLSHEESHDNLTKEPVNHNVSQDGIHLQKDESQDQVVDNLSVASDQTSDSAHSEGRIVHMVPKQQPPPSGKKKKRRALRPGHAARKEEDPVNLEVSVPVSPPHEQFSHNAIKKETEADRTNDEVHTVTTAVQSPQEESTLHETECKPPKEDPHIEEELTQQTTESNQKDSGDDSTDSPIKQVSGDKEPETQELVNLSESEEPREPSAPAETVDNDLADVFTVESANYEVELSAQEELVTLLESFESGLQKIRYGKILLLHRN